MSHHVYLSPHLDDAVLSCGGLIAQQVKTGGRVTVLTVCAGDPKSNVYSLFAMELHERWGAPHSPVAKRRSEDQHACHFLGAITLHLDIPDAIYRCGPREKALYSREVDIFAPLHKRERNLVDDVAEMLRKACPHEGKLYCPMAVGGHVDHRLTRLAAESLGRELWYYQDMPYAARGEGLPLDLSLPTGRKTLCQLAEKEIEAWATASSFYHSQLSTFWPEPDALRKELRAFHDALGGILLVAPPSGWK